MSDARYIGLERRIARPSSLRFMFGSQNLIASLQCGSGGNGQVCTATVAQTSRSGRPGTLQRGRGIALFARELQFTPRAFSHRARSHATTRGDRVLLAVGPEGGWDEPDELDSLARHGFERVTLGERTLRTDVAVVSLLAIANEHLEPS